MNTFRSRLSQPCPHANNLFQHRSYLNASQQQDVHGHYHAARDAPYSMPHQAPVPPGMNYPAGQYDAYGNWIPMQPPRDISGRAIQAPAIKGQKNLFTDAMPEGLDGRLYQHPAYAQIPSTPMPQSPPANFQSQSPPWMHAQPQASFGQAACGWDNWTPPESHKPVWKISRKNTEGMFKFDGSPGEYRAWKSRVRDHCSEEWVYWRDILDHAEKLPYELKVDKLNNMTLFGVNAASLSSDVWVVSSQVAWANPFTVAVFECLQTSRATASSCGGTCSFATKAATNLPR